MSGLVDDPYGWAILKAGVVIMVIMTLVIVIDTSDEDYYRASQIIEPYETMEERAAKEAKRMGTLRPTTETRADDDKEKDTDVFKEYMDELRDRDIELGSPEAQEIWDTYY